VDQFPSRARSASVALEPRVSAIVVTRNTGQSLDLCLRSALAEPWIDDLVIVDAGNPAPVSSALRALQADRRDVKLVHAPDGASLAAAGNLGAAEARGRWLLFLDPHVVLQRGGVARMAAAGGGASTPWIVGGRLTDTQGRDRRAARAGALNAWSAIAVAMDWPGARPKPPRRKKSDKNIGEATKVAAVSGAFMLIPRGDFSDLGGFDEGFATDAADLDLCRRAADAGGSVLFQPAAAGVQFAGAPRVGRREAQGLALFVARSARTPIERAFAIIARPALALILALRDLVGGRPPVKRGSGQ
jgi:N-acetylglucosaminyl-diphospho-decaprenol L-rhamnosyltransferase